MRARFRKWTTSRRSRWTSGPASRAMSGTSRPWPDCSRHARRSAAACLVGRQGVLVAAPADDLAVPEGPVLDAGLLERLARGPEPELVAQVVEDVFAGGLEVGRLEPGELAHLGQRGEEPRHVLLAAQDAVGGHVGDAV